MPDAFGYALSLTVGLAMTVSLATLFRLFQKHIDGRPLLEYEPRQPAPWNVLAPLVMLAPLVFALWSTLFAGPQYDATAETTTLSATAAAGAVGAPPAAWFGSSAAAAPVLHLTRRMTDAGSTTGRIWASAAMTLMLAACSYLLLTVAFGATPQDLGFPRDWRQACGDVKIGAVAWAASLVPIYAILLVLNFAFEPTEGHPLIENLLVDHSLHMMAAAAFAAVIAAPLYEETAFRLVLQGWLERRELLARRVSTIADVVQEVPGEAEATHGLDPSDAAPMPQTPAVTFAHPQVGWSPIAISSVLFGLAHYGHGVSPAPLILLGVVLGYLYRQTHRILPCIVCHLLFNAFTFVLLALQFAAMG
ncbi:MAG: CPBP family intramembrane metalloprotease [Pirellulales bacterium]|nr:CPBP family intramembrane metalloprotease [Pirellulales bacterium]